MATSDPEPMLSVVVIGLNEERTLRECFVSIGAAINQSSLMRAQVEVIYVDSGSRDRSPAIAEQYADRLVRLTGVASAAAARQAGLETSTAEIILFVDGDMLLAQDWLRYALPALKDSQRYVGITGQRDDVFLSATANTTRTENNVYGVNTPREAPWFGGALMIHRRSVINVGGYNPCLKAFEEPDLYSRLLARDMPVLEVPQPFISHLIAEEDFASPARKIKRQLYFWVSLYESIRAGYFKGFFKVHTALVVAFICHLLVVTLLALGLVLPAIVIVILLGIWGVVLRRPKLVIVSAVFLLAGLYQFPQAMDLRRRGCTFSYSLCAAARE